MPKDDGLEELLGNSKETPENHLFYDGTIQLLYNASLHAYYMQEGETKYLVPGVTTVGAMVDKSGPLTQWAANSTVQYLREKLAEVKAKVAPVTDVECDPWEMTSDGTSVKIDQLEALFNEARFNYRTISKTATDIGTIAHDWLERLIKAKIAKEVFDENLPDNPKSANSCLAATDWMQRHNFRPLCSERKIYSREFNYAGTEDWEAEVTLCDDPTCCPYPGEALALGDFKSSKAIYDEYRMQLAAYQHAVEEEYPSKKFDVRIILRIDKEGEGFETLVIPREEYEADFDGFLGTLQMYVWAKQLDLNKRGLKAEAKALKKKLKDALPKKPRKKAQIKEAFEPIPIGV